VSGNVAIAVFTNATQVDHLFRVAAEEGLEADLRKALGRMVIASIGPVCSEALEYYDLRVDLEPEHPKMGHLVASLARRAQALVSDKRQARSEVEIGQSSGTIAAQKHAFLAACSLEKTAYTPVWFMRQAGRYMKEYRALREKFGFLELCKRPDLATEIAVDAVERLKVDAAILFSDILLVLEPLGVGLEYSKGDGPVIHRPIRASGDVESLPEVSVEEELGFVFEAVRQTRAALNEKVPLIGFSGAPFTLVSYMIEGGGSHSFVKTKRFIHSNPEAWHRLMERLSRLLVTYLNGQVAAGAQALQVFDSWVGCLGPEDYRNYVLPHMRVLMAGIAPGIPVIHFSTGTAGMLKLIRSAGGGVIGLDWRVDLDAGWEQVGYDVGVQGNLDPVVLFASVTDIRRQAQQILRHAAGRPGHIFNLGHGVLSETPVENVLALVDIVHELSSK
jgi:uroporphyrinogen decarboxylase